ncbi:hypothetical protein PV416_09950 [Streptomyces ipomoeae]|uniref:hypothetical protein n=1 Tax=Streptomyces ipomoeae TaxID=103232 RepID=UPI001319F5D9|nr:hypothetical protein [Streptomyces ipomoeae]MDX2693719.1 hypothetical protein [Streptomyces ipomoeae]MDX2821403.1 hypothetical protein [Streptomyces ipomoeae]MDX2839614.1 hypothetical protein [Streptomyces ipomoeae]MDX2874137.1 hypothetical protein [Streptomyces ipomoeae]
MTPSDSEEIGRREQHNHGSGTFIGGDNHGGIHFEMVDAKTKALLAMMAKQSPALARLLRRALEDGVISPDTVDSLARAARNINEDVANQLRHAAQNINEDVAHSLMFAGERINPAVARKLADAADSLNKAVGRLDVTDLQRLVNRLEGSQRALNDVTMQMDRLQRDGPFSRMDHVTAALDGTAERMERLVTPPAPKIIIDRKAQWYSFLWGIATGAALMAYLLGR